MLSDPNFLPELRWMKDRSGKYVDITPAAARVLGLKREDVIGRTDKQIMSPELAKEIRRLDLAALKSKGTVKALLYGPQCPRITYRFPVGKNGSTRIGGFAISLLPTP